MKFYSMPIVLMVMITLGCAHGPQPASSLEPTSVSVQPQQAAGGVNSNAVSTKSPDLSVESGSERLGGEMISDDTGAAVKGETPITSDYQASSATPGASAANVNKNSVKDENLDFVEDEGGEEVKAVIADPLEPFNRVMYHFNDKLYFWVLKPVAQGYEKVVPEGARISVRNFFSNIAFPIRFVNCLLQANLEGASTEIGRFVVNTILGIGGLWDPASSKDFNLVRQDKDLGQTLGVYGMGQGLYINWPILGPSSPRDTAGMVGDFFLHPFAYLDVSWKVLTGARAYEKVNDTSLSIGDYEALKDAAVDPYIALRDAYVQYRLNKVQKKSLSSPAGSSALRKK